MPFVHIFHGWDRGDARAAQLADGVHQALIETFAVPTDDLFQAISSRTPSSQLRIASEFLGVRHSADAVFVQITCAPGRSVAQKKALYAAIASNARTAAGMDPRDVIVNLVETSRENWSFGNGLAQLAP